MEDHPLAQKNKSSVFSEKHDDVANSFANERVAKKQFPDERHDTHFARGSGGHGAG